MDTELDTEIIKDENKSSKRIGRCFELDTSGDQSGGKEKTKSGKEIFPKKVDGKYLHYYIELVEFTETTDLPDSKDPNETEENGEVTSTSIVLEKIDGDGNPTGELIQGLTKEDFSKKYLTCSEHDCQLQPKTIEEISKKMAENRAIMGEEHLKNGELDEAEDKFSRALKFDENSVRATLGMGKTKLEQEKVDEAMEIFNKLSEENSIYEQENKHTLNDFGIYLRKKSLYQLAIDSYEKAIQIDPEDEALYFNLGRAHGENGEAQIAIEKMNEAIEKANNKKPTDNDSIEQIKLVIKESEGQIKRLLDKEKEFLDNLF